MSTYTATVLEQSLIACSQDILALAGRGRIDDDAVTLRVAARDTRYAAYLVKHQVYDAATGYAWLDAARAFHLAELERGTS
jgi:hypothetical protein